MDKHFIITVGRELGSGGRLIGEQLAKKLNISFYDRALIMRASKETGLSYSFFENTEENINPILTGGLLSDYYQDNFSNESLFQMESNVILEIAEQESAVIVGRGADYVLRQHPHCLNVFITANIAERIAQVSEYQNINAEKALALIEKVDKKRAAFYNFFSTKKWGAAQTYDLCINSSVLGLEKTTDFIMQFANEKFSMIK